MRITNCSLSTWVSTRNNGFKLKQKRFMLDIRKKAVKLRGCLGTEQIIWRAF